MAGMSSASPAAITLADITDASTRQLRPNLLVDYDFTALPPAAWELLVAWYGLARGARPLERAVVVGALGHPVVRADRLRRDPCLSPLSPDPLPAGRRVPHVAACCAARRDGRVVAAG